MTFILVGAGLIVVALAIHFFQRPTQTALVHTPARPDNRILDRIDRMQSQEDGIFGFFDTWTLERQATNTALRNRVATELVGLEGKKGDFKRTRLLTAKAEYQAELEFSAWEAIENNKRHIADEATANNVPYERYAEIYVELAKHKISVEMKRFDMQLKLDELYQEDVLTAKAAQIPAQAHFAAMEETIEKIARIETELLQLQAGNALPLTITARKNQLQVFNAKLNEQLAQVSLQENRGGRH